MTENLAEDLARDSFMQLWMAYCAEKEKRQDAEARLAEVERLLQEVYDGRQSLMSIGLVYRIGHTLNHRPAASAGTKHAYHETHEPPHCPTCDCAPDSATHREGEA